MRSYDYLSRNDVGRFMPQIEARGVSKVARRSGFTKIYLSGENPRLVMASQNLTWHEKRHNFLKRHLARDHALFDRYGEPTRHHLALIAWAYSPSRKVRRGII